MYNYNEYSPGELPWFDTYSYVSVVPIKRIVIEPGVTSIGDAAFSNCKYLTSVTIADSVISIGEYVFVYSSLTSVTIPGSVTSIEATSFKSSNLTEITVAAESSSYAAENSVLFNKGKTALLHYPAGKSGTEYSIPDSVTSIGRCAFMDCRELTRVEIPDSVTSIGQSSFSNCENLTGMKIPNSVASIGDYAFYRCKNLANVKIPNSVLSIGERAFGECKSLTSVTIPGGVASIGNGAFSSCEKLTGAIILDGVTSIGDSAFNHCRLASVIIPGSVDSIGKYAFGSCNLTSVTIQDGVTSIGDHAFYNTNNLRNVMIPKSVTSIGDCAFKSSYQGGNLTDVYYGGNESDWVSIQIGSENTALTDAVVHYNSTQATVREKRVGFFSPLAGDVFTMSMDWGWDLLLKGSSISYDSRLAEIALALSGASERSQEAVEDMLIGNLEVDPELILSANYNRKWYETGYPGVTIGHRSIMQSNGKKSHIITIVIRGTTNAADVWTDLESTTGAFSRSANNIYSLLETYIEGCSMNVGEITGDNAVFFVAGHSLGGAVANILAKELNEAYGRDNVFAYTFAAPRSTWDLFSNDNKNILNILNTEDTVPVALSTQPNRYGIDEWFSNVLSYYKRRQCIGFGQKDFRRRWMVSCGH